MAIMWTGHHLSSERGRQLVAGLDARNHVQDHVQLTLVGDPFPAAVLLIVMPVPVAQLAQLIEEREGRRLRSS